MHRNAEQVQRTQVFPQLDALAELVDGLLGTQGNACCTHANGDDHDMRLAAEYLEQARHFELLAKQEQNLRLRRDLAKQADAYRKLAAARFKRLGMTLPGRGAASTAAADEFA